MNTLLNNNFKKLMTSIKTVNVSGFQPCSLAIAFHDSYTGDRAIGNPRLILQRENQWGDWILIRDTPVTTPSGIIAYFKLEHRRWAVGLPPVNYRFTVESDYYLPAFLETKDFESTQIHPYDDYYVPPIVPKSPIPVLLYPSIAYPFTKSTPLIRGKVQDSAGQLIANALVSESAHVRVLTDARGQFVLPANWVTYHQPTPITAQDRLQRTGHTIVVLPESFITPVVITIT